jgi:hypothetical protein
MKPGTSRRIGRDFSAKRPRATVGMFAYVFTVKLDGWRRFCAGRQLVAEALMTDLPAMTR